jgi:plastocyanin
MTRVVAALATVAVLMVGCSSGSEDVTGAGSAPVETTEVSLVKSYRFEPETIEVETGAEVTWVNEDDFPHNVHLLDADTTHDLGIGDSASVTFDEAGEFDYECSIHPQMKGRVVVRDGAA